MGARSYIFKENKAKKGFDYVYSHWGAYALDEDRFKPKRETFFRDLHKQLTKLWNEEIKETEISFIPYKKLKDFIDPSDICIETYYILYENIEGDGITIYNQVVMGDGALVKWDIFNHSEMFNLKRLKDTSSEVGNILEFARQSKIPKSKVKQYFERTQSKFQLTFAKKKVEK